MSQETERYQLENNGNSYLVRTTAGGGGADVEANPEGTATADLEKLKVGETIYGIPEGTEVVANPTLAGTESALTGLQVGDTKYAVESGLPTTGGTMTGNIKLNNQNAKIIDDFNNNVITANNSTLKIGDTTTDATIYTGNWAVRHIKNNASYNMYDESNGVGYTTTAPTANNTKGGLVIVVLPSEPATRYNGYLYIITA